MWAASDFNVKVFCTFKGTSLERRWGKPVPSESGQCCRSRDPKSTNCSGQEWKAARCVYSCGIFSCCQCKVCYLCFDFSHCQLSVKYRSLFTVHRGTQPESERCKGHHSQSRSRHQDSNTSEGPPTTHYQLGSGWHTTDTCRQVQDGGT